MSRRASAVLGVVVMLLLVVACGEEGDAAAGAPGRPLTHEFGTTTVPLAPRRVVALDEAAAMSALAVGIRPAVVYPTWGSPVAQSVLRANGVPVVPAAVGPPPAVETVLDARPDLVLFTSTGDRAPYDGLSVAVPTVPLPSTARPWTENVDAVGAALGREGPAARVRSVVEARIGDARAAAGPVSRSITALISYAGTLAMSAPGSPGGTVIRATGSIPTPLPRFVSAAPGAPYAALSPELLPEVDADLVLVFGGGVYDAAAVTERPLYRELGAVRAGRTATVLGEPWFATDPFSTWWIAGDLAAVLRGRPPGAEGDGAARFTDFERSLA